MSNKEKKYFEVDCWETAVRFRTVGVEADSIEEAREKALWNVDFEGADWNSDGLGTEDVTEVDEL